MTFRPSNERGRDRTDYHAGRILIPHQSVEFALLSFLCDRFVKIRKMDKFVKLSYESMRPNVCALCQSMWVFECVSVCMGLLTLFAWSPNRYIECTCVVGRVTCNYSCKHDKIVNTQHACQR